MGRITTKEALDEIYSVYPGVILELGWEYKGIHTPIKITCPLCGYTSKSYFYRVINGFKCSNEPCRVQRIINKQRKPPEKIIKETLDILGPDYELVYYQSILKNKFRHKTCGKERVYNIHRVREGQRCGCEQKHSLESAKKQVSEYTKDRWELIDPVFLGIYEDLNENGVRHQRTYNFRCTNCGYILNKGYVKIVWQEYKCPHCNKGSYIEQRVTDAIRANYTGPIERNIKPFINPLTGYKFEIDIYLPKLQTGLEINGTYWHSNKIIKEKYGLTSMQYKLIKSAVCFENDVALFHIPEQNIVNKTDVKLIDVFRTFVMGLQLSDLQDRLVGAMYGFKQIIRDYTE